MYDYLENEFAEFWIDKGILFFVYKPFSLIDLNAAEKIVADRLKLQRENAYPIFCDTRGIKDSEKAARDYLAIEGSILAKAVALLVKPPITEAMTFFYIKKSKPVIPTKIFTDKEEALEFVESYRY